MQAEESVSHSYMKLKDHDLYWLLLQESTRSLPNCCLILLNPDLFVNIFIILWDGILAEFEPKDADHDQEQDEEFIFIPTCHY